MCKWRDNIIVPFLFAKKSQPYQGGDTVGLTSKRDIDNIITSLLKKSNRYLIYTGQKICYNPHMIELLILYVLTRREFTMYGISKEIASRFAVYTSPSFGAIKPALRKLEANGLLESRKSMSEGGKLSVYYSITPKGEKELHNLIKQELTTNPLQFIPNAKIKLSMSDLLDKEEKAALFLHIKTLALMYKQSAEKILNDEYTEKNFYQRILLDNSSVEYSNLVTVIEGFEKDNARNS